MVKKIELNNFGKGAISISHPSGIRPRLVTLMFFGVCLTLTACSAGSPPTMDLAGGKLPNCPSTPNCVCSEINETNSSIGALKFAPEQRQAAWEAVRKAVVALGGRVEKFDDGYLWATFRSRVFRFVDDLQLRLDAERDLIQVRSASRLGYSDFGVNRQRVENLRVLYDQQLAELSKP